MRRRLRILMWRHLLGPIVVERLRLAPTDFVLVRVPEGTSTDEAMALAYQMKVMCPGHRPLITDGSLSIESLPREHLMALLEDAKPSKLPYGAEL